MVNGLKTIIHCILAPEIKIYIAEEFSCKLFSVERTEIESKRVEKDMPDKQNSKESQSGYPIPDKIDFKIKLAETK